VFYATIDWNIKVKSACVLATRVVDCYLARALGFNKYKQPSTAAAVAATTTTRLH
jgi:hypothetical protein